MKLKLYRFLFRVFSVLSNRTNGTSVIVKYKLLLGTIIIGLTGTSCALRKVQQPTCYDAPYVPEKDSVNISKDTANFELPHLKIMCYIQLAPVSEEQLKQVAPASKERFKQLTSVYEEQLKSDKK